MEGEQPTGAVPGKSTKSSAAARGKGREPLEESSMDTDVENEGAGREPDKDPPQGRSGLPVVVLTELQQPQFHSSSRWDLLFYKATLKALAISNCF